MPLDPTDDKSTLVQEMAWCHQATSHYLCQCWSRSMLPYGITRPHWVKQQSSGDGGHLRNHWIWDLTNKVVGYQQFLIIFHWDLALAVEGRVETICQFEAGTVKSHAVLILPSILQTNAKISSPAPEPSTALGTSQKDSSGDEDWESGTISPYNTPTSLDHNSMTENGVIPSLTESSPAAASRDDDSVTSSPVQVNSHPKLL